MRFLIFLLVFGWGIGPVHSDPLGDVQDRLVHRHGGADREYYLYEPEGLTSGAPLVIALHGLGGRAERLRYGTHLNALADQHGFAVAYPQGAEVRPTTSYWNAAPEPVGSDDVGFLTSLVSVLEHRRGYDPAQTYVVGISNGGVMAYDMACRAPMVFEAIAVIAGTMSGADWQHCDPSRATPVLHVHGTEDELIPWEGETHWLGPGDATPAIPEVVQFWAARNGADTVQVDRDLPGAVRFRYGSTRQDDLVWFLQMDGFGHDLPNLTNAGFRAVDVAWEFFRLRP
ncbi:extracellular catalytic domain type 1 short-chain-length polyhydroxyalkanoate depolymerase [Shimia ponticola]|uniref:extracellular catalytic domain type 1 short-chain-length polyhydroxyalkanoate depolymerase n=1 Tax=Shimia ponticola TaxID=2582893 RepID=UPI0011BDC2E0|nr:PHB depolymerase family esterase [Shimia ponticola]